jgi:hypothetical protein
VRNTRYVKDVMIVDYDKCMRVPVDDERWARAARPYRCPLCATDGHSLTPRSNSARLRFDGDPAPKCEDHETPVDMVAV